MNDIINNESVNAKIRIGSSISQNSLNATPIIKSFYNQSNADFINSKTPQGKFNLLVI
jgi:hypothetical protein